MTHETFRDYTKHEKEVRAKILPVLKQTTAFTLEEVIYLQGCINDLIFRSLNPVDEKNIINQETVENVEESI